VLNDDGSKVDIHIEVPGSDPNINLNDVDWELLEQIHALLEATPDGEPMMVHHKDNWGKPKVTLFYPQCLPKLYRAVSQILLLKRISLSVQGGKLK
jgi:hypothetical protein